MAMMSLESRGEISLYRLDLKRGDWGSSQKSLLNLCRAFRYVSEVMAGYTGADC
jgi:hypothetical protein